MYLTAVKFKKYYFPQLSLNEYLSIIDLGKKTDSCLTIKEVMCSLLSLICFHSFENDQTTIQTDRECFFYSCQITKVNLSTIIVVPTINVN